MDKYYVCWWCLGVDGVVGGCLGAFPAAVRVYEPLEILELPHLLLDVLHVPVTELLQLLDTERFFA